MMPPAAPALAWPNRGDTHALTSAGNRAGARRDPRPLGCGSREVRRRGAARPGTADRERRWPGDELARRAVARDRRPVRQGLLRLSLPAPERRLLPRPEDEGRERPRRVRLRQLADARGAGRLEHPARVAAL